MATQGRASSPAPLQMPAPTPAKPKQRSSSPRPVLHPTTPSRILASMADAFMHEVLAQLIAEEEIDRSDAILVVGAGELDAGVTRQLRLSNCTLSDLNHAASPSLSHDAMNMAAEDGAFDHVIVHAALHHMSRPHAAICEMYRVARKSVLFFESEDTVLMRLAVWLGVSDSYECNASLRAGIPCGVDDTLNPNYVYRWQRREVEKLIRSLDTLHEPNIRYFKRWNVQLQVENALRKSQFVGPAKARAWGRAIESISNKLLSGQANSMAVRIQKHALRRRPTYDATGGDAELVRRDGVLQRLRS